MFQFPSNFSPFDSDSSFFFEEGLYSREDSSGLLYRSNLVLRTRKPGGLTMKQRHQHGGGCYCEKCGDICGIVLVPMCFFQEI